MKTGKPNESMFIIEHLACFTYRRHPSTGYISFSTQQFVTRIRLVLDGHRGKYMQNTILSSDGIGAKMPINSGYVNRLVDRMPVKRHIREIAQVG